MRGNSLVCLAAQYTNISRILTSDIFQERVVNKGHTDRLGIVTPMNYYSLGKTANKILEYIDMWVSRREVDDLSLCNPLN